MQVALHGVRRKRKKSHIMQNNRQEIKETRLRQSQQRQERMVSEQSIIQAITQAVIKAAIRVVREVETPSNTTRPAPAMLQTVGPGLKQSMFNWTSEVKYMELCDFEIEV